MKTIVLQWPSFGPYHTARLRACQAMAGAGVKVVGLAVAGQVQGRPWVAGEDLGGVEIVTLFPDAMYHELDKAAVKKAMKNGLDDLNPDAVGVSGYGMTDSRAALHWCRKNNRVRVLMTESKADDAPRSWWKEAIKRHFVKQFDSAHCGGSPHRAYLQELGMKAERIYDRYDVVDNERFSQAAKAAQADRDAYRELPGLDEDQSYFLVSSRFIERKNIPRLLAAYQLYRTHQPEGWRLIILGTGPDEAKLRSQVSEDKIPDVTFAGFQQFDQLVAYYAFAGAFIHPALQEQWGLVVNEAMACGLPIGVSRTVGAAYDLVQDGVNGYTFDPMDEAAMTEALVKLSSDPVECERMSASSREIIKTWTPEHFAENFWEAVAAARP
ncbi:hexosyltransferase [Oceaniferula spumae]|uniref:Hexosyltransferase n=1 Tax=Oceaniferula spumae TaxID=2979115 RepID=A0AAT9FNY1_9BACT